MTEQDWTEERLISCVLGVVRGLHFARPQLRGWYDGWLAARRLPGAPVSFAHAMVVTGRGGGLDPARDADALCLALAALRGPQAVADCFAAAVSAGLFDIGATDPLPVHRRQLAQRMIGALGLKRAHASLQRANTESLVNETAFWTDPGNILPGIILGRRRLCRIEALNEMGDRVTGSGFLIGPSTVLTNFHVIKDVIGLELEPGDLQIRFDYSATTGIEEGKGAVFDVAEDWLIAHSETGPVLEEDYAWDKLAKRRAWLNAVEGFWDYAAIRLTGAPGLQRGWFDLARVTQDVPNGVWVLHHPGSEEHTITGGKVVYGQPRQHRLFHQATTAHGSSGGLALDQNGQPVALHYLGLEALTPPPDARHHRALNVAVPLTAVASDLTAKGVLGKLAEIPGLSPVGGCLDGRRPVFGRADYIAALEQLWKGDRRILRVHVETDDDAPLTRPGKSFSVEILRALFAAPEHHHIVFRAGDVQVDAYRMACDTLASFAPDAVASLPEAPDTTTPAYVKRLVSKFMQQVSDRLGDRMVWILLDDLDRHDLSDASGREFLSTLYDQIGRQDNLRLVLIGLREDVQINGLDPNLVLKSAIRTRDLADPGQVFRQWLNLRGARDTPFDETSLGFLSNIVASLAGAEAPLERMSEFVETHVAGAADALFGRVGARVGEDE